MKFDEEKKRRDLNAPKGRSVELDEWTMFIHKVCWVSILNFIIRNKPSVNNLPFIAEAVRSISKTAPDLIISPRN